MSTALRYNSDPQTKDQRNKELLEYSKHHSAKETAEYFGISLQRVHSIRNKKHWIQI